LELTPRGKDQWEDWEGRGRLRRSSDPGEDLDLQVREWRIESEAQKRLVGKFTATASRRGAELGAIKGTFDLTGTLPRPLSTWQVVLLVGAPFIALLVAMVRRVARPSA